MWVERILEVALGNAGFALVLALTVAVASRFVRRPAVLHVLWLVVLLRLLAPPVFELALLPPGAATPQVMVAMPLATEGPAEAPVVQPAAGLSMREVMLAAWLLGGAVLLVLAAVRTGRLLRALGGAQAPDAWLTKKVRTLASAMGVGAPQVRLVQDQLPPMLWGGLVRPELILPAALLPRLSEAELETLLGHELAHLRRRDHWVRYLELLAVTLFWWNPVAWWASHSLRAAEEECCDALVTRCLPGTGRAYAGGLVKTMRYLAGGDSLVPVAVTGASHFRQIERRIRVIMSGNISRNMTVPVRAALAVLVLAALAITPTLAVRAAPTAATGQQLDVTEVSGEPINLVLEAANLKDVLRTFGALAKFNVVIDPGVTLGQLNTPITVDLKEIPWDEALDSVLRQAGLAWTLEGAMLWVHPPGKAPAGDREFTGEPISLNMQGADIKDFLGVLEKLTNLEIEVDPDVTGQVTASLNEVPWDQALDLVLKANGLSCHDEGGVLRVSRAGTAGAVLLQPKMPIQLAKRAIGEPGEDPVYRFTHGSGITEPECVSCPKPECPADAADLGLGGRVIVKAVITADGRVADAEVVSGLPSNLADSTLETVQQWVFEPARLKGEPVAVEYVLSVNFAPGDQ